MLFHRFRTRTGKDGAISPLALRELKSLTGRLQVSNGGQTQEFGKMRALIVDHKMVPALPPIIVFLAAFARSASKRFPGVATVLTQPDATNGLRRLSRLRQILDKSAFRQIELGPVFKLLGAREILKPRSSEAASRHVIAEALELIRTLGSRDELLKLKIRNVLAGDLIYDEYLIRRSSPTLPDLQSPEFFRFLLNAVCYCIQIDDHLAEHNYDLIVGPDIYLPGYAFRSGSRRGIPSFFPSYEGTWRIGGSALSSHREHTLYLEESESLNQATKLLWSESGLTDLSARLLGNGNEITVRQRDRTSTRAFCLPENRQNEELNVLVATHDFSDSPHILGEHLYPDFWVWLERLGEISTDTKYNWYLKTHPGIGIASRRVVDRFLSKNQHFAEIPSDLGPKSLSDGGIDWVLTVNGSVGFEFPFLGTNVLPASTSLPWRGFEITPEPRSRPEFESLVLNLKNIIFKPNLTNLGIFYYLHSRHFRGSDYFPFPYRDWSREAFDGLLTQEPLAYSEALLNHYEAYIRSENYYCPPMARPLKISTL